jgi:hypothetical protein
MGEPTKMNFKISYDGGGRKSTISQAVTLESISNWIRAQELDEYTTKGLIDIASKYPNQALSSFRKNINVMIARVRQKRKEEQGETKGDANVKKQDASQEVPVASSFEEAFKNFSEQAETTVEKVEEEAQLEDQTGGPDDSEDWT